jgi:nucleotide-binding universal stress UspA family protein
MKRFHHILVPTDFSETAREALRAARDIASDTPDRISIVHVISDVMMQPWVAEGGPDIVTYQREWEADVTRRLEALVTEEGLNDARVTTAVLVGKPAVAIAHYADEQHADLIVMGTHGHGPVRRLLLGSVAERVVRLAHCPVLTVPHESLRHAVHDEAPEHEHDIAR